MIDAHIHYAADMGAAALRQIAAAQQLDGMALMCLPKGDARPTEDDAFAFAKESSVPVYVFGSIPRSVYALPAAAQPQAILQAAQQLMARGCTGIKMLEGKPDVRKNHRVPPFNSAAFAPFWQWAEQAQTPVVFHVNDPADFWNAATLTEFQIKAGWYYDDTYINNEVQYTEVLEVLARHPQLRVLFPHFFFMSEQLPRLGAILDAYPHVMTDVTPGVQLVYNLGADPNAAAFFARYQTRICYGTDMGARQVIFPQPQALDEAECRSRYTLIQTFLRAQAPYTLREDGAYVKGRAPAQIHPLCLSTAALQCIFNDNFLQFIAP